MDIDFTTIFDNGFAITLGTNPLGIIGNRALLNRFEITLLTKRRQFVLGDQPIVDNFGGDAQKFINRPQVLSDIQSISAALATAVDQTVQSMLMDQTANIPDTEKIVSAEIISINVIEDTITATIRVYPVLIESYEDLVFNLPLAATKNVPAVVTAGIIIPPLPPEPVISDFILSSETYIVIEN